MASVAEICAKIDGMVGTMALSSNAGQAVACWIQHCKDIMRLPANRNLTTWKFQALSDIDEDGSTETGDADLIAATKVYGLMVGTVDVTAEHRWVAIYDADSATFDGTAALANSVATVLLIQDAASASAEEYYCATWQQGFSLGTGMTIASDGVDGANTEASELRGWVLYI
jgi:hypothetical protein